MRCGGPLIGPRGEVVEQRRCVPRVPAFDGGFSAEDHRRESRVWSIGKSKPAAASSDKRCRASSSWLAVSVGHRLHRSRHRMGDVREYPRPSGPMNGISSTIGAALPGDIHELHSDRWWWRLAHAPSVPIRSASLANCSAWSVSPAVSDRLGAPNMWTQLNIGWLRSSASAPGHGRGSDRISSRSPAQCGRLAPPPCRPEQQHGVTDSLRSDQRVGCPDQLTPRAWMEL